LALRSQVCWPVNARPTLVASTSRDERARVRTMTMRWGMSMVIVGPIAFVALLMALGG
jgi:hypothetical protein